MRKYYPNYSIGTDAYADIPMVCEKYGTKAVIIGGTHALAAAADLIKEAVADSNIMITGVFEYGGEASREHIDELNSHQEVIDADMIFACGGEKAIDTCKVMPKSYSQKSSGRSHSWNYRFYWFCINLVGIDVRVWPL